MPDVRYNVPGVPPGPAAGITAFMPQFIRHAASGAQAYKYDTEIYLGLRGVPAPTGDTQMSPDAGDMATGAQARSQDAPQAWWPQKGFQRVALERPGAGMPIKIYNPARPGPTTLLPVPAQDFRAQYGRDSARLSYRAVLQRARSLPWFPRVTRAEEGTFNG